MKYPTMKQYAVLPIALTLATISLVIGDSGAVNTPVATISKALLSGVIIPGGTHVEIDPIIIGGGGHYGGPGDTVPPCDGCTPPPGHCNMPFGYGCDAPICGTLAWVPDIPECKYPQYGPYGQPLIAQGYMLTIGNVIQALQSGTACTDVYGNITVCIQSPFPVEEVHVFESGWINGLVPAPIGESVTATVCIDNQVGFSAWPFDHLAYDRDCEYVEVCISFSAACMQQALLDWYMYGVNLGNHVDDWLFYVDFVSCIPCEDGGVLIYPTPFEGGVIPPGPID